MSKSKEFYFLLDSGGALIAFQETGAAWAGVLAFSAEAGAREFARRRKLDAAEVAAIDTGDTDAVAALVRSVKRRAIRSLLLDLDYATGRCIEIGFEGEALGKSAERQFKPNPA
ncbi:MAG TPA: hypothetical protein VMU16_04020 [Candidatus Binataceae bacterium]|nr:hypothetical protein [Candidatus Binataceae bacterium]